jgi:hypothetical protein
MPTFNQDDELIIEGMLSRSTARELAEDLVQRCGCTFSNDEPVSECEYHRERREALTAILQAARTDEKGEWWTARKYLDDRRIFNDDISSLERLIEIICTPLVTPPKQEREHNADAR